MEEEVQVVDAEILGSDHMLEAMTRGEIDQQVATAKKYPRSIGKFRQSVLTIATSDQETAESCFYALPWGGKPITGPSVRFAEIIACCYGNLRMASRVIAVEDKVVVCEGACHDLENNNAIKTQIRRSISGKAGRRYSDDMIIVTANAGNAIALRNAILKVVPPALLTNIEKEIRKVGLGNERTIGEKRNAALQYFKGKGIKPEKVFAMLEIDGEADITLKELSILHGLVVAINEGDTTIEEIFSHVPEPGKSESTVADKIAEATEENKKNRKPAGGKKESEKKPEAVKEKPEPKPEKEPDPEVGHMVNKSIYEELQEAAGMGFDDALNECLQAANVESLESIENDEEKLRVVNETFREMIDAMTNG